MSMQDRGVVEVKLIHMILYCFFPLFHLKLHKKHVARQDDGSNVRGGGQEAMKARLERKKEVINEEYERKLQEAYQMNR